MDEFGLLKLSHDDNNTPSGAVGLYRRHICLCLCNTFLADIERKPPYDCCYIHPTYGTISRYGLIPLASSLDQIGIVCEVYHKASGCSPHLAGEDQRQCHVS